MRLPKTVELPAPGNTDFNNSPKVVTYMMKLNEAIRGAFRIVRSDLSDIGGDTLKTIERSSDPAAPVEGKGVIWQSDGTGKGDDGDIMIASTAGGVTKYGTIFDHSGGTPW